MLETTLLVKCIPVIQNKNSTIHRQISGIIKLGFSLTSSLRNIPKFPKKGPPDAKLKEITTAKQRYPLIFQFLNQL